ncbi:unnamed protein product, partial [Mesorhabditis spiculigera]
MEHGRLERQVPDYVHWEKIEWSSSGPMRNRVDVCNSDEKLLQEEQCRALGATISSVTSNEENDVIIDFAKTGYPGDTIFSAMIGAKRIGPNATDFAWLDGSPFTFYPWANGEPNNVGGRENCIMIWTDEIVGKNTPYRPYLHMWNDVDCDAHRRVAVCKKAALY